jgi:hypothetical protein
LLEAMEDALADNPDAAVSISGTIHNSYGKVYLLPTRAMLVPHPNPVDLTTEPATTAPADASASAAPVSDPPAAPSPLRAGLPLPPGARGETATAKAPSAEDVAAELLKQPLSQPIVDIRQDPRPLPTSRSVAPQGTPLPAGPGRIVANRFARVTHPKGADWYVLVFEGDNTLQEPPLRVLPNDWLDKLIIGSASNIAPVAPGAIFQVSGQIYRYRGNSYILLHSVIRKREVHTF